jgi:hypothetical protein
MNTMRERFELTYCRQQGHVVRSRLLFRRNADGRYSNRALELTWCRYKRGHVQQLTQGAA